MNPWKQRYRGAVAAAAVMFAIGCGANDGTIGADGALGASGANGHMGLIKTSRIPAGDATCPAGGLRIDTGLDNGDGGGTANDGVLQDGEIDATQRSCDGPNEAKVSDLAPPGGATGAYFINSSGGNAGAPAGRGGDGGDVYFQHDNGTNGGAIKLFKTGQVDATFTVPTAPATSNYGATPLNVTGNVHVKRVAAVTDAATVDGAALVAGDIVETSTCGSANRIYKWNSTSSADLVTGIHIQTGATLTFDHAAAGTCTNRHYFTVDFTVRNEGIVTVGRDAAGTSDRLYLWAGGYLGTQGSSIVMTGANNAGAMGGGGGYLQLVMSDAVSESGLWNFGTINNSGGNGTNGGDAGGMYLWADGTLINTGAVTSRGGDASDGSGVAGDGGDTDLYSGWGLLANSGLVDVSGGNGGTVAGDGGSLDVESDEYGDLKNTGELRSNGGTPAAGCATICQGGDGGGVDLYAWGDLWNSANVSSTGGAGLTGTGGDGGTIYFYTQGYSDTSLATGYYNERGTMRVSGNVDSRGGDGTAGGGDGGEIYAETSLYYSPFGQEIVFYGYGGGINANGGNGHVGGGNAYYVGIYQNYGYTYEDDYTAGGAIVNYVDINVHGGTAASGVGGDGGYVEFETQDQKFTGTNFERIINHGNIDASGGTGVTGGGEANYVILIGVDGVENHGNITARGGAASAAAGAGGACNPIWWESEGDHGITLSADRGPVINTGNLDNRGGDAPGSTSTAGYACGVLLLGYETNNSGDLNADGGDAPSADGFGGDGGPITVNSYGGVVKNTGALTAAGGTGLTDETNISQNGVIIVNGQTL